MPQFQSRKEQVLERLNFESFYKAELQGVKPAKGDNVLALCPFHDDHNPSLSVNLKSGLFKCFACEAAGDVFAFWQKRHDCDFKEALEELGRIAGVEDEPAKAIKFKALTLKEFALAKKLPLDFLKKEGVQEFHYRDGTTCVDFPYKDAAGRLMAVRHRYGGSKPNKFRYRKGDKALLYGLWRLAEIRKAGWYLLVEGESDALTCWLSGVPALGIPGKENFKAVAQLPELAEMKVFLWEEPDAGDNPGKPGSGLAAKVAAALPGLLVIKAPDGTKDLSEAHCRGEDIKALVEGLKAGAQPPAAPPAVITAGFAWSDLGNARRLVAEHGRDLRYCHLAKKWYFWNGKFWEMDNCGETERRAKQTIASIYQEAAACKDFDARQALAKFALKTEDSRRILAMVRLALSEPGIPVNPRELDAHPFLFNCLNGTLDLTTGELRPHEAADMITCMAPVVYHPKADCQQWEKFLDRIHAGNWEVITFLQRALGYALTGSCKEQCLFIFFGSGANGKSTLLGQVQRVMGNYALNTPVETLLSRNKGSEIPTDIARLDGPRLVTAAEADRGRRLAESLVKQLTGRDDLISARFLYGEYFDFVPQFKLFLSTNNKPMIRGTDNAIWRRIKLVEFPVELPESEWDRDLPEKLQEEAPGILAWLVAGCLDWYRGGLGVPQEVIEATAEYRAEMDVLQDFLSDTCVEGVGLCVTSAALYQSYCDWAKDAALKDKEQLNKRNFGVCLTERGFRRDKGSGGVRLWRGLGLRSI